MQLLGEDFTFKLTQYLKTNGFGAFLITETYKYFGYSSTTGKPSSKIIKNIEKEGSIDFCKRNFIFSSSTNNPFINNKFKDDNIKLLKKAILEFYDDQNILFCPYCGLNQFQIITDDKLSSFDLDHFLPKSIFPQFALSLYNLFPVCKFCNQTLKRDNNPLEHNKMVFHPIRGWIECQRSGNTYTLTIKNTKSFDDIYDCSSNWNGISGEVFVANDDIYKHHLTFFKLKELYLKSPYLKNDMQHIKYIHDHIKRSYAIPLGLDITKQKIMFQNMMTGWCPTSEKEILKYSAGKLKKDIYYRILDEHFKS